LVELIWVDLIDLTLMTSNTSFVFCFFFVFYLLLFPFAKGWWSDSEEKALLAGARSEVMAQLRIAEKLKKPPMEELFNDV
jgi:hypothetical protein